MKMIAALAKTLLSDCEPLFSVSKILLLKTGKVRTLLPMTNVESLILSFK